MSACNQSDLKRQETLKAIETMSLLDDNLMTLAFDRNKEAAELLLHVILRRDDLTVLEVIAHREYKNPMSGGRSITIDIYARDKDDKIYDVEVQRASAQDVRCIISTGRLKRQEHTLVMVPISYT